MLKIAAGADMIGGILIKPAVCRIAIFAVLRKGIINTGFQ